MLVYNIRKAKYATTLKASGVANRWNKSDEFVIYAGSSISLSVLEMVAHRNAISMENAYKLLFIDVKITDADVSEIKFEDLPPNWKSLESYPLLQNFGSEWYNQQKTLLLKVPSVLVQWENNYLINTKHPDFVEKISIQKTEDFLWDGRLL